MLPDQAMMSKKVPELAYVTGLCCLPIEEIPPLSRSRITGTVEEALPIEESLLGRKLLRSFCDWLLENNGLDIDEVHIYPVRDERATRKIWESLSYLLNNDWVECLARIKGTIYAHLLPFADFGTGDFYCFDYSVPERIGERPVVLWSRETGNADLVATDFKEFRKEVPAGLTRRDLRANPGPCA